MYLVLCDGRDCCCAVGLDAAHTLVLPHLQILCRAQSLVGIGWGITLGV